MRAQIWCFIFGVAACTNSANDHLHELEARVTVDCGSRSEPDLNGRGFYCALETNDMPAEMACLNAALATQDVARLEIDSTYSDSSQAGAVVTIKTIYFAADGKILAFEPDSDQETSCSGPLVDTLDTVAMCGHVAAMGCSPWHE